MGFMTQAAILKTLDKLVEEQRETNRLIGLLIQAQTGRAPVPAPEAPKKSRWGSRS